MGILHSPSCIFTSSGIEEELEFFFDPSIKMRLEFLFNTPAEIEDRGMEEEFQFFFNPTSWISRM
jgi:hypothetical protein